VAVIIIDPDGLFHGKRLARCSDQAQWLFPRLLLASNGYGRLEVDFDRIRYEAFWTIRAKPTDDVLRKSLEEYEENSLLFLYEAENQTWGQWDVRENWLPRYKNAIDRRSPAPDAEMFKKWQILGKSQNPHPLRRISENFGNSPKVSESFRPAVAVAVVGAVAVAESSTEVVGAAENSENGENPEEKPASEDEGQRQRHQIAQRGQERLLQLRKERSQKEPTAIGELFAENFTQVGEKIKQQIERINGRPVTKVG
jgi:hypothetical protein